LTAKGTTSSSNQANLTTKFKVGLFTILALLLVGAVTVFVNDRPFWWRPCNLVHINIDDATGLKTKSPVRSLGLQIGYLKSVELSETYVRLGICITAQVEVLPTTRAYIKGEGFLGDKFVELKPVRYTGPKHEDTPIKKQSVIPTAREISEAVVNWLIPSAMAETPAPTPTQANPAAVGRRNSHEIPVGEQPQDVQEMLGKVDDLVKQMTDLTTSLKQGINPQELRSTLTQLNKTLENTSRVLSPEGGLNSTAQRTLAKLEDAIEQMRDQMTRVNRGEGSLGSLLNDPKYAQEIEKAIQNVNKLLGKVGDVQFVVDIGAAEIPRYDGGRAWFLLSIWPQHDRYYRLGVVVDPRGKRTIITTTTSTGNSTTVTRQESVEQGGILLNGMIGKVWWKRLDLSVGVLYGDGAVSIGLNLGPHDREDALTIRNDVYNRSRGQGTGGDYRGTLILKPFGSKPFSSVYLMGGLESVRKVDGRIPWLYGAGITFTDDDIKLLFALR
jgi:phospholipid/cholesterol/gamma-HCH transport system substrate-binding protein